MSDHALCAALVDVAHVAIGGKGAADWNGKSRSKEAGSALSATKTSATTATSRITAQMTI